MPQDDGAGGISWEKQMIQRTYTFVPGGQRVECVRVFPTKLVAMVRRTGDTFYCQPGARTMEVPPAADAVLNDLLELRWALWNDAPDMEARTDAIYADLERDLSDVSLRIRRHFLFGVFHPAGTAEPTASPRDWADVSGSRLVAVLVPPQIHHCEVESSFDPAA